MTPESENLTLSSSGAIDQSSCTGTPLSSTISSPEGTAGLTGAGQTGQQGHGCGSILLHGDAEGVCRALSYPAVDAALSPRVSPQLCHP